MSVPLLPPERPELPQLFRYTHQDVEKIADILALVTAAFVMTQMGSWAGIDNWIVALALGVAIAFLIVNYNGPIRVFLRRFWAAILEAILSAFNLLYAFIYLAINYYGGDILRMLLDMVIWALAGWIFERLVGFPAIQKLIVWLQEFSQRLFALLKQVLDWTRWFIQQLDKWVREAVDWLLGQIKGLADLMASQLTFLREFFLQHVALSIAALRVQLLQFWNQGMREIHGRLDDVWVAMNRMREDVVGWALEQFGALRVQIGDLTVNVPLVAFWRAYLKSLRAPGVVDLYVLAFLDEPTGLGKNQTNRMPVMALWVHEDIRDALAGRAPIDQMNQWPAYLEDLIREMTPKQPPVPV